MGPVQQKDSAWAEASVATSTRPVSIEAAHLRVMIRGRPRHAMVDHFGAAAPGAACSRNSDHGRTRDRRKSAPSTIPEYCMPTTVRLGKLAEPLVDFITAPRGDGELAR